MNIRIFLAIEISEEVRQTVAELSARVKAALQFTAATPVWVEPEAMHLTLKFLGEVNDLMVDRISERLTPVCAGLAPFDFGVRGLGVFPSAKSPKVLWVGVRKATEELERLHFNVQESLAGFGFKHDARKFHPHLTLARIKSLTGSEELMKNVTRYGRLFCGNCTAKQLVLFRSDLKPSGAVYTRLAEYPFLKPKAEKAPMEAE